MVFSIFSGKDEVGRADFADTVMVSIALNGFLVIVELFYKFKWLSMNGISTRTSSSMATEFNLHKSIGLDKSLINKSCLTDSGASSESKSPKFRKKTSSYGVL